MISYKWQITLIIMTTHLLESCGLHDSNQDKNHVNYRPYEQPDRNITIEPTHQNELRSANIVNNDPIEPYDYQYHVQYDADQNEMDSNNGLDTIVIDTNDKTLVENVLSTKPNAKLLNNEDN